MTNSPDGLGGHPLFFFHSYNHCSPLLEPYVVRTEQWSDSRVISYLSDHFTDVNMEDLIFTEQTSGFVLTRTFVN